MDLVYIDFLLETLRVVLQLISGNVGKQNELLCLLLLVVRWLVKFNDNLARNCHFSRQKVFELHKK